MSDLEQNLRVLTSHLDNLADEHAEAGGNIKMARRSVEGLAGRMWQSHGVICARTNLAVANAEAARATATATQSRTSDQLEERLRWAGTNYNDTDWLNGQSVAACSV